VFFELVGDIDQVGAIASGRGIRELDRLQKRYGRASWRKMKGIGEIRLRSEPSYIGMGHMASGNENSRSSAFWIES
jgi:hypothetical protein